MSARKAVLARLIIGPLWLIFAFFIVIPLALAIGFLYGLVEIATLLTGKSLNAQPKWSRPLYRQSKSLWEWNYENVRWIVGSTDPRGFQALP